MLQLKHIIVAMICCLGLSSGGLAQDKDASREQAKAFYKSGQAAFKAERYGEAISFFEKAYNAKNHPALLVNIARIYEAVNDLRNAIKYQKLYGKAAPQKAKDTSKKIAELRATHASWPAVQITSVPSGEAIRVSNLERPIMGKTPMRLKLPDGQHTVFVGSGKKAVSKSIVFKQGTNSRTNFTLLPTVAKGATGGQTNVGTFIAVTINAPGSQIRLNNKLMGVSPMPSPMKVDAGSHTLKVESPSGEVHEEVVTVTKGQTRRVLVVLENRVGQTSQSDMLFWGSVGLGSASILAGTAMGIMALNANSKLADCRSSACAGTQEEVNFADDVRSKAQLADILWGCGLALGTVSTILWFQEDETTARDSAQLRPDRRVHWDTGSAWGGEE